MIKFIHSRRLILAIWAMLLSPYTFAQKEAAEGMHSVEGNYTSFKERKKSDHIYWQQMNDARYYNHPEFGRLPEGAPCTDCIEIYGKRNTDERYFVDIKDTHKYYLQKALGEINEQINGTWRSIEHDLQPAGAGIYRSKFRSEPVSINVHTKQVTIETALGAMNFSNWSLWLKRNNQLVQVAQPDWSDVSLGADGMYIKNVFEGIDAEVKVYRGATKTNFIIKSNQYGQYEQLIFRDAFNEATNTKLSFEEHPNATMGVGKLKVWYQGKDALTINEGIAYAKGGGKELVINLPYVIADNQMDVLVDGQWIRDHIGQYTLVVDPLVTGSGTLAQAAITGSMYNGSCNFTNSCNYTLNVTQPASSTITNIQWTFTYTAAGSCWLYDGATRFTAGTCVSPGTAGYYWFCNQIGTGTCTGTNVPIYTELASCLPPPSCNTQIIPFGMQFFRSCWGSTGCNNTCIGAGSPWVMTLTGQTIDFTNPTNAITLSPTAICTGESVTATTVASGGVPAYTYSWSLNASGTPVVGTGATATFPINTAGTQTVYAKVTDQCGNNVQASKNIVVTQSVVPAFNQVPPICVGASIAPLPSTSTNGINGTWSPTLSNAATGTYTFTPAAGQCAAPTTMTVVVNPILTPTFTQVPPICIGSNLAALPTTSGNGVTGTWSPAMNNTTTTTYTFTPAVGQCATGTSMTIVVNNNALPTFTQVAPICSGAPLAALPTNSNNSITGSWAPALNNTTTTTYTFTPTAGQCALPTTMTIVVNPNITPVFNATAPICQGDVLNLPTTATNGITGTWSPAMNNAITTTYTFTPTAGICAPSVTKTVVVKPKTYGVQHVIICNGDSYTFNGIVYTSSNTTALDTFINAAGCDSIVRLDLDVKPVNPQIVQANIGGCVEVVYQGTTYHTSQILRDTLYSQYGCDSIYNITNIIVHPEYGNLENTYLLGCGKLTFQGFTHTKDTLVKDTLRSVYGCDSIYKMTYITIENFDLRALVNPEDPYEGEYFHINTYNEEGIPYEAISWTPVNLFTDQTLAAQQLSLNQPANVVITAKSARGCLDTAKVNIVLRSYKKDVFMPNAFSPNGDGRNDVFYPNLAIDRAYNLIDFKIFNKWGQVLFATDNAQKGWDGTFKGQVQGQGVYFYTLAIVFMDGSRKEFKGDITLLR
ncbi:gliding motility-associated C-terminal domain-containing protein [Taibaiella sp. KBW10]|uniref:T9SS type B sorting domain-containing protein n=1 Tax=Taibaiella sp. KBW10 TaxID=2153357 RepID=UPI000F5A08AD|nr:gliding motility-associated C-terminal domain-containing protein [Taibaiella sp. KBW10]